MKDQPLTPFLQYMTDGYADWQQADSRRRRRLNRTVSGISLFLAVALNVSAFALPKRYSFYSGSYGPHAVLVIDKTLAEQ